MTDATKPPTAADIPPIPPRYWWLKRILLTAGFLVLALVALRWWWGYEAQRRLQAKIDEYHALGQPVTIDDFQFPPVPDEENAAYFLIGAATAVTVDPNSTLSVSNVLDNPEMMDTRAAAVRRLIAANVKSLPQTRMSRSKARVDWGVRFTQPLVNITGAVLPLLSAQRELGRLLWVAAVWQHRAGDDAAAVETLRDAIAQVEQVGQIGVLIAHLTAMAIDGLAVDAIETIAADLAIGDTSAASPTTPAPARREQVQALIADLLNETGLQEAWRRSMYGERLQCLDTVNMARGGLSALTGGPAPPSPFGWELKPMFQLDAIFMMEFCTAHAEAGLSPNYQQAKRTAPRFPAFESNIERNAHMLSWILLPSLEHAVDLQFRELASRRLAATALAIRLYEVDHGHRPRALSELVPDYISAIPSDPFSPDGAPIGYRPDADPPVLYSVGDDGVDDGGEFVLTDPRAAEWKSEDQLFFLNGDRPRTPPASLATQPASAEAVEDEGEEVGRGGGNDHDQPTADQP